MFKGLGKALIRFCLLLMAGWATVAILYSNLPAFLRPRFAAFFGIASLGALIWKFNDRCARLGFLAGFAVVLGYCPYHDELRL
jgi:hypothetical protein